MQVGLNRIKRLRRHMKIRCKQAKKYKATTDSNHKLPVAPNLLNQNFAVSCPNKVWVADITDVSTGEGWLYLAGIKDLWNREIVGYAMGHRMTQDLVGRALFRVFYNRLRRHANLDNLSGSLLEEKRHAAKGCVTIIWCPLLRTYLNPGQAIRLVRGCRQTRRKESGSSSGSLQYP
ncbi:MAG: hypothetical protein C0613_04735 [Desulfobulbaceae bacterium]|nr:MAG: hypothetical protein C0613_04735 [Desulfobulbaceae bacterium]